MKIAVIDDSIRDRQMICEYLHTFFHIHYGSLSLSVQVFESGEDFLHAFLPDIFDMIFIDLYMSGMSGLETARLVRDADSAVTIIFITASRDFAVEGYKVRAAGYLVKPFSYEEFTEVLLSLDSGIWKKKHFLSVLCGSDEVHIFITDIIYCDIFGHYVQIHTTKQGIKRTRMTFSALLPLLEPYPEFLLCFRGCIINLNQVRAVNDLSFVMSDNSHIPIRKKELDKLKKIYTQFLFEKVRESQL